MTLVILFAGTGAKAQGPYIHIIKPLADQLGATYGIPASLIMAVAIIESGGGNSRNSKLLNNHFGIKGKNSVWKTHSVKTAYKQYSSVSESFVDFCKLLSCKKFYEGLKGNKDYKIWINALSNAGYSTAPVQWRRKVLSAIQKYRLS